MKLMQGDRLRDEEEQVVRTEPRPFTYSDEDDDSSSSANGSVSLEKRIEKCNLNLVKPARSLTLAEIYHAEVDLCAVSTGSEAQPQDTLKKSRPNSSK